MRRSLLLAFTVVLAPGPLSSQESCWSGTSDQVGARGNDRVIQKDFEGLRVCALGRDLASVALLPPSEWQTRAPVVLLETQLGGAIRRLRLASGAATFERDGSAHPIDSSATEWRSALLDVLNATWQLERLGAREPAPRADVAPTSSQPSGAHSMSTAVPRPPSEFATMRAELDDMKAEWRKSNGEITSLQAESLRLQKDRADEQRVMSDAQSRLSTADSRERARINREIQRSSQELRRINDAIRRVDTQLRSTEQRLGTLDLVRRIEKLQRQLQETSGASVVAEPEPAKDVESAVAAADRQLSAEVDRNIRELFAFRDAALRRLRATLR